MQPIAPSQLSRGILSRFWYGSSLVEFFKADPDTIMEQMVRNGEFDLLSTQRDAWLFQINFLQSQLADLTGSLFLEFSIPRMGRRIDAVLLVGGVIFVIEFKVGAREFERAAIEQAWDYALDLKNFHEASHSAPIIPILIATESTTSLSLLLRAPEDKGLSPTLRARAQFSTSPRYLPTGAA